MCGISGFINPAMIGSGEGLLALAEQMANALAHRGPDDHGMFSDSLAGLGLAHRRLAVLDPSPSGAQPMQSMDGRFVLLHNGEVYNFLELRKELEAEKGAFLPWRSNSDTEAMLAAFSTWGIQKSLTKFTGMFAFALWDREKRCLTLARDRMGEKPLYYAKTGAGIVFGSELKALRVHPDFRAKLNAEALASYLRFQYVPEPLAIYQNTWKLPPGHFLTIQADAPHELEPKPYWSLYDVVNKGLTDPFPGNDAEAANQLEAILRSVIRNQMLSDVPLGSLLSGGIDSSLVTALMQAESDHPINTFTIGFKEAAYDESHDARAVADHLGTNHTELTVTPSHVFDLVGKLPTLFDEPFADASQLPTHLVAQLTRKHVTVCLTGDGGDETFAGYNRHHWAPVIWKRFSLIPRPLRSLAAALIHIVPPKKYDFLFRHLGLLLPQARIRMPGHKAHKFADVLAADTQKDLYKQICSTWPEPSQLFTANEPPSYFDQPGRLNTLTNFTRWMQYQDSVTYLPGDILHKVDRATMGVALESRSPYLDHRVIEFAWRLPLSMLLKGSRGKHILRTILHKHLPSQLIERPKMGFGLSLGDWLRGPLRDWAHELLDPVRLKNQGLFNVPVISRQLTDHMLGRRENQYRLWNILIFQIWFDRWM